MSDDRDLDRLKAALKDSEPQPQTDRKAKALARAMAEFDRVQGSAETARQTSGRPEKGAGVWTGVTAVFNRLTTRAALAGTASIAVIGIGLAILSPEMLDPDAQINKVDSAGSDAELHAEPFEVDDAEAPIAEPLPTEDIPEPAAEPLITGEQAAEPPQPPANAPDTEVARPAPPPRPVEELASEIAETEPLVDKQTGDKTIAGTVEMGSTVGEADSASPPGAVVDLVEQQEPRAPSPGRNFSQDHAAGSSGMSDRSGAPLSSDPAASSEELNRFSARQGGVQRILRDAVREGRSASPQDVTVAPQPNTEAFPEAERNDLKVTAEEPVSTFSIDVDTASYSVVRSSLNVGQMPPPSAVRIEEMINYFPYAWPTPDQGEGPFRPSVSVMETPWNAGTQLVTVALQGRMPALEDRQPLNLVFLIDTSGSMQDRNKLPLLKQSFRLMLSELRPEDEVAVVTYAGSAGQVLAPTPAAERETILAALDQLEAGGSTAGQAGLQQAYSVAGQMAEDGEVTRVLLATDGDFNVGISDPEALKDFISEKREDGAYLSVLGFGRGNLDDATMQALAQNGNGTAAYIDTLSEARKVLVDQLSGALFPIADDVKIQVEWNPATVAEYRLIGYETRALAREDFNNDRVDAGEIGAGHAVTAIYEVTPVGSPARLTDPLRYSEVQVSGADGELGFLRLRYKEPGEDTSRLIETPILTDTGDGGREARFAAAIAGFGQLLTGSSYLGDWTWADAIDLANGAKGDDPFGYRAEAIQLMRLAESISN